MRYVYILVERDLKNHKDINQMIFSSMDKAVDFLDYELNKFNLVMDFENSEYTKNMFVIWAEILNSYNSKFYTITRTSVY